MNLPNLIYAAAASVVIASMVAAVLAARRQDLSWANLFGMSVRII